MATPDKLPLFRQEVLQAQQSQWLGTVLLAPRLSFRFFTLFAALAAAGLLGLLFFTEYTAKARINGWLVPDQGVVRVVAPQGGLVIELAVHEGETVEAGAVLARVSTELRSEGLEATRAMVVDRLRQRRGSLVTERQRRQRLQAAELSARQDRLATLQTELDQLARELGLQRQRLALAERTLTRTTDLARRELAPVTRLDAAQEDQLDQALRLEGLARSRTVLDRQRLDLVAELERLPLEHETLLAGIDREIASLDQELAEAEARREVVVTAPVAGVVTGIQAELGSTVSLTAPLMSIVPEGAALEAQMFAPGRAIGFVRPGQPVLLRYQAYPYQKFGFYRGTVRSISRAAVNPADFPQNLAGLTSLYGQNEPVYRLEVELEKQTVTAYGEELPLEADVLLETRRLVEWVLDPLYTLTGRA